MWVYSFEDGFVLTRTIPFMSEEVQLFASAHGVCHYYFTTTRGEVWLS